MHMCIHLHVCAHVCMCRCICKIYIYMYIYICIYIYVRVGVWLTWLRCGFLAIQIQPCLPEVESPPSSAWVDRQLHESVRRRLHHLPHPWSGWTAEATRLVGWLWHFVARPFGLYGIDGPKKDIFIVEGKSCGQVVDSGSLCYCGPVLRAGNPKQYSNSRENIPATARITLVGWWEKKQQVVNAEMVCCDKRACMAICGRCSNIKNPRRWLNVSLLWQEPIY